MLVITLPQSFPYRRYLIQKLWTQSRQGEQQYIYFRKFGPETTDYSTVPVTETGTTLVSKQDECVICLNFLKFAPLPVGHLQEAEGAQRPET